MKNTFLFLFLFMLGRGLICQVVIPYKAGEKFGLSDTNGKILVAPAYDNIEYLQDHYFQYVNYNKGKSNSEYTNYDSKKFDTTGLFYKSKLLISNQSFHYYLIYYNCIVASENPYHPEECALFNLRGEPLINEPIKALGINDKRDFGDMTTASTRYSLIMVFQRGERRERLYSIAVLDNDTQKISEWLLKKVSNFQVKDGRNERNHLLVNYYEENGFREKYLVFKNGKFQLINKEDLLVKNNNKESRGYGNLGNDDSPPVIAERDDFLREEPNIVENGNTYYHPEKIESYGLRGDSLFYFVGKDNIYLDLPAKTSPILLNNKNTRQSIPVIYKRGKKFGLIIGDTIKENIYDSLVYFGNNYIAAIKNKNGYHFGMLNKKGEEIVPFIYDSIIGKMNRYNFIDNSIEGKKSRIFTVNSPDRISKNLYVVDATEDIVVYKNGKTGMINKQNQIIIPIEYDIIAENKISYYLQARTSSNIVLLKKDGLYGLTFLEYNYNSKHNEMKNTVPPVYQHIPCYYYNDYCNIKGFKLFGLYNESFDFLGYAHPNGTLYFSR